MLSHQEGEFLLGRVEGVVAEGILPNAQREWKFLICEPAVTPGEGMGDAS